MNKINVLVKCLFLVITLGLAGCNKDLQDDVDNLKDRVTTLEESVTKLKQAMGSGKLITSVTPIVATATTPSGWEITLSDKSTISIYNGEKGDKGDKGDKGESGLEGLTPYIWVNGAGNWANNLVKKPADPENATYEIKADGNSVAASGSPVRSKNVDGFVGLEEYDAVSGVVIKTVKTTTAYEHKNYVTAIIETPESVIMTISGVDYRLSKAAVYPMSITVIRDKEYVIKGGTVEFNIAVNPSTSEVYTKDDFELDYEKEYLATRGITPDFIQIKDVVPATIKGQYTMILEWAESNTEFAKDAAIFIILNFTDVEGKPAQVVSATPVIMNEKYVSIAAENVLSVNDIYMFTDETFTDSVRLSNYHEGYVNTVNFTLAPSISDAPHMAVNDFTRYTPADKYKFTVVPIVGSNAAIWPANVYSRIVDAKASVTDHGRAAVPAIPADPYTGQPAVGAIPAIAAKTIDKSFKVHVFKVPTDNVIYTHDFKDYWIPNKTVDYRPTVALSAEFAKNGYILSGWDFAIKSQTLKKDGAAIEMTNNITVDASKFDVANNFTTSYKLLPTINSGVYTIEFIVTATPKTPRATGLSQSREFKVLMNFKIVAPSFQINIKDTHNLIGNNSDTYFTYKLSNVNITDLLDVESTKNISKATDISPNVLPLGYEFDMTDPRHGAQGVRFTPYPAVTAPAIAEWSSLMFIKRPVSVIVKLDTGQEIPTQIVCTVDGLVHGNNTIYVQYTRLNLDHVIAASDTFKGNYNTMISTGINIAAGSNFTPQSVDNKTLDPTMIKTTEGIVFSEIGTVQCQGGILPSGLAGKKILSINSSTGLVKSIDGMTWENPDAVLYQTFRVTYTDIWGNSAYKDVNVYVKSNSIP